MMAKRQTRQTGKAIEDEDRAEMLMDHYKDTFGNILTHWKARNRLFLYALALLALIGIDQFSGCSLAELVNGYLSKSLKQPENWPGLDFSAVNFVVRFVLLCVVIQYYQRSIQVDRLYNYIHRLEDVLCRLLGTDAITREGKSYFSRTGVPEGGQRSTSHKKKTDERPRFLRAVAPLYVYAFPVGLSVLVLSGVKTPDRTSETWFMDLLSAVCSLAIAVYSALYMLWVTERR